MNAREHSFPLPGAGELNLSLEDWGKPQQAHIWLPYCEVFFVLSGGLPGTQMVKRLPVMREPGFNLWVRKIPCRRKWQPTPKLLPGKFHGWRSLVGYRPWDRKELDTTEQLHWFTGRTRGLWTETGEPGKVNADLPWETSDQGVLHFIYQNLTLNYESTVCSRVADVPTHNQS